MIATHIIFSFASNDSVVSILSENWKWYKMTPIHRSIRCNTKWKCVFFSQFLSRIVVCYFIKCIHFHIERQAKKFIPNKYCMVATQKIFSFAWDDNIVSIISENWEWYKMTPLHRFIRRNTQWKCVLFSQFLIKMVVYYFTEQIHLDIEHVTKNY